MRDRSNAVKALTLAEIGEQDLDVLFLVWLAARATHDLLDTALAPSGLTSDEFAVYSVLATTGGITPSELARWMAAPPTTVSSYVKRFEGRGHVERETTAGDRRSYRVRLTPAGLRAYRAGARLFAPVLADVTTALGRDAGRVVASLQAVRAAVDRTRQQRPPRQAGSPRQARSPRQ